MDQTGEQIYDLSKKYIDDDSNITNLKNFIFYLKLAGEKGHLVSQIALGKIYTEGNIVEIDSKESFKWYKLAAEQGDIDSQCSIGQMYLTGEGVEENHKEALRWFSMASDKGHDYSTYNLGHMYLSGYPGIPKDTKKAIDLITQVADKKNSYAMLQLGVIYAEGIYVKKDINISVDLIYDSMKIDSTIIDTVVDMYNKKMYTSIVTNDKIYDFIKSHKKIDKNI